VRVADDPTRDDGKRFPRSPRGWGLGLRTVTLDAPGAFQNIVVGVWKKAGWAVGPAFSRFLANSTRPSLELVGDPGCYEVDGPVRWSLPQKLTGEKVEILCCNAHVPVYGPFQLCACVNSDIARRSAASGSQ